MDKIKLGTQIKNLRKLNQLNQKELGELVGLSQAGISVIEKGGFLPSTETLLKIASTFNVPISTFIENEISESEEDLSRITQLTKELEPAQRKILISLLETFIKQTKK